MFGKLQIIAGKANIKAHCRMVMINFSWNNEFNCLLVMPGVAACMYF
jgi:hypothetical protein